MLIDRIRLVAFDATGTLILPEPSVSWVYWHIAQQYGCELSQTQIKQNFLAAMHRRTETEVNEETELEFWRSTVASVLGPVNDPEKCFRKIYDHFAAPQHWQLAQGAPELLEELATAGIRVCIASNFDHRLRLILRGIPELCTLSEIFISTEIGARKPDPKFFTQISKTTQIPFSEILMVGDELKLDIEPAAKLGMHTFHLESPVTGHASQPTRQRILSELGSYLKNNA